MTKGYDFSLHCFPVSRPTQSTEIAATRGQVLGKLLKVRLVRTQISRGGDTQGEESVGGPAAWACPLSRHSLILVWSHVPGVSAPQWLNARPLWHRQTLPLALLSWCKPASAPPSYSVCGCCHHLLVLLFIHVCILATRELFKVTEIVLPLGVHWQGKDNF